MPKVSIIVPVYNVEAYLSRCIESILCQTMEDLELILIDDGSPDGSGALCDAYQTRDSRIQVIHQRNTGVSGARNAGLAIASGDYLGFVDPDDFISPDMVASMLSAMEKENCEIGICGFAYCTEEESPLPSEAVPAGVYDRERLLSSIYGMPNEFHGSMCNKLFARRILEGLCFDRTVAIGEDWLLLYECYLRAERAAAIDLCGYTVRVRSGSATRRYTGQLFVNKQKTYYRLYQYSRTLSPAIQKKAAAKILDTCYNNKRQIMAADGDRDCIGFVNRQLREIAVREFSRGNLSAKHAVYHFWKGMRYQ